MKERLAALALKVKIHATVFLIGFTCAMIAYGFIHLLLYAIRALQRHI